MPDSDLKARREVDQLVRQLIFRHFLNDSCPPGTREIARSAGLSHDETTESLRRIAQPGVVSLAPGSDSIWMAHPFAGVSTGHTVTCGSVRYQAPCAMDALTVALFLDADTDVLSHCGDCGVPTRFEIRSGRLHGEGFIHSLLPPSHWFDNISFTCQTTLFFTAEDHVRRWCEQRGVKPGGTATAEQFFVAAKRLLGRRTDRDWSQPTHTDRMNAFAAAGLSDEWWQTTRIASDVNSRGSASDRDQAMKTIERARLTDRELEILSLLAEARSQKQIAHSLSLSVHTVDTHVRNIYTKLKAHSRAAAVATALRTGLI